MVFKEVPECMIALTEVRSWLGKGFGFEVGFVDPAGFGVFAALHLFVEAFSGCGFVLVEDGAVAVRARVPLGFEG